MKRLGGVAIGFIAVVLPFMVVGQASARGCSNVSSFGAVELNVPLLPDIKNKVLWLRMQAPDQTSKVLADINQSQCLEIGGTSMLPGQWSWQSSPSGPISFESFSDNVIRIIGVSGGVKIDRIILTEPDCVPRDFGNNCRSAIELKTDDGDGAEAILIPSPSGDAVGGKVILSQTPDANRFQLDSVDYVVNAKVVQTVQGAEPFDTTLVPNGKYNVQVHTKLKDGKVIREVTVIEIRNAENFYTPVVRWVRLNFRLAKLIALALGGLVVAATLYNLLRMWHLNRRQRRFHGF